MLTVICWLWKSTGWRHGYSYVHVNAMQRMLERHLKIPHRLVCVTDNPEGINCETVPLWEQPIVNVAAHSPNCYRRLWVFSGEAREIFGDVILSIDLDCVIMDDITPIIDTSLEFKINKGIICPYNGAMWLLKTGSRSFVWNCFDPEISPGLAAEQKNEDGRNYFGSDQAWISYCLKNEAVWTAEDGIYHFSDHITTKKNPVAENTRIMFFAGRLKPWMPYVYKLSPMLYNEYQQYLEPEQRTGQLSVDNL